MYIHKKTVIGIILTILLLVGVGVAVYLSGQEQDPRQRAAGQAVYTPPANYNLWKDNCPQPQELVQGLRGCVAEVSIDGKAFAQITNTTTDKTFTVGIASYKAYQAYPNPYPNCNLSACPDQHEWVYSQTYNDGTTAPLAPGQTVYLQVNVPACSWQVDIFEGQIIQQFTKPNGHYEGQSRLIDGYYNTNLDLCVSVSPTTTPPACIADQGTCEWSPLTGVTGYTYKVVEEESGQTVKEGKVASTVTKVTFTVKPNNTYTCTVAAENVCGVGPTGEATATCAVSPTPTPTRIPTPTPTNQPTATPTPTMIPTPTSTPIPTATPIPPTPTTPPPPVGNPPPVVIATPTPVQIVVEQPTSPPPPPPVEAPGSALQTITVVGGLILTAIGALILFIL